MLSLLIDSNIVIYACSPEDNVVRPFLMRYRLQVSEITRIETLGYHKLERLQRDLLNAFFHGCDRLPIDMFVIDRAIELRQSTKIGLADAIIAATAIREQIPLCTRNVSDFENVRGLRVWNPYEMK